ncbi:MAG: Clp protease N-terminal domain-containing protein [Candidatus Saccharimonadales bacterium]
MFEYFSDRARRVIVLSQDESRSLGHNYIGVEHVLLGLIRENEAKRGANTGVAAMTLKAMGIDLTALRLQVGGAVKRGTSVPSGHITFTDEVRNMLILSQEEAKVMHHDYTGTEHLLLGLIGQGGVNSAVFTTMGIELNAVRNKVIELLDYPVRSSDRSSFARLNEIFEQRRGQRLRKSDIADIKAIALELSRRI